LSICSAPNQIYVRRALLASRGGVIGRYIFHFRIAQTLRNPGHYGVLAGAAAVALQRADEISLGLPDEVTDGSKVCDGGRFEALIQVKGRAFSIALAEFHALAEVVGLSILKI
jgi:hypothetical protein